MRAVRINLGDGSGYALGVVPEWGWVGGEECDAGIQIVRDADIECCSYALIFVGEDVGENLPTWTGLGSAVLLNASLAMFRRAEASRM